MRNQYAVEVITQTLIDVIKYDIEETHLLTNESVLGYMTSDNIKHIVETENANRSNYIDLTDENYISALIIKELDKLDDADKVTEIECVSIIESFFTSRNIDPNEMVDKSSARDIALQVYNDNIGNSLTATDLTEMIQYQLLNVEEALTEDKVLEIVEENIAKLPQGSLNFDETVSLVHNSIDKVITNTINSTTLINYVLKQLEVKKWICEVTKPFDKNTCSGSTDEYIIHLRAPREIFEGETIDYHIILTKAYQSDIIVRLSNGLDVPIIAGKKLGHVACPPSVHGRDEDVYKNQSAYIVNIDTVDGLDEGYEKFSTDVSSVAMTRIKDTLNITTVSLNFDQDIAAGMDTPFTVSVSNVPQTNMKVMCKFQEKFVPVDILAGELTGSGILRIEDRGIFFASITDAVGGNFETLEHDGIFEFTVLGAGKHVLYSIDAPKTAKEGDTVVVKFKVNKPNFDDETIITADINGETKNFTIAPGEIQTQYSFTIEDNVWKD